MKGTHLGEFEELVLLTIGVLIEDAYGVAITLDIKKRTGRNPSIGALHSALSRLEKKGFVNSEMEGATAKRRGRRKKFYRLTSFGVKTLKGIYEMRTEMAKAIPNFAIS
jgi:DNA-binding PadR family transcriptional regulator